MKMNLTITSTFFVTITTLITLSNNPTFAYDNLGNVLHNTGWNRIIGTWVDAETLGDKHRVNYSWRFKNHVIQSVSQEGHKKVLSLMGYSSNKGEVFHVSVDDQGGSSIGRWTFTKDSANLGLLFVTGAGDEGAMRINFTFYDDNTMIIIVDLPEPITIKMIRIKTDDS